MHAPVKMLVLPLHTRSARGLRNSLHRLGGDDVVGDEVVGRDTCRKEGEIGRSVRGVFDHQGHTQPLWRREGQHRNAQVLAWMAFFPDTRPYCVFHSVRG